jgi:hypothetical protein
LQAKEMRKSLVCSGLLGSASSALSKVVLERLYEQALAPSSFAFAPLDAPSFF